MRWLYIANSGFYRECIVLNMLSTSATISLSQSQEILYVPIQHLVPYQEQLRNKKHHFPKRKTTVKVEPTEVGKKNKNSTTNTNSKNHPPPKLNTKRKREEAFGTRKYPFDCTRTIKRRRFQMASEPQQLNIPNQENDDNKNQEKRY